MQKKNHYTGELCKIGPQHIFVWMLFYGAVNNFLLKIPYWKIRRMLWKWSLHSMRYRNFCLFFFFLLPCCTCINAKGFSFVHIETNCLQCFNGNESHRINSPVRFFFVHSASSHDFRFLMPSTMRLTFFYYKYFHLRPTLFTHIFYFGDIKRVFLAKWCFNVRKWHDWCLIHCSICLLSLIVYGTFYGYK